MNKILLPILGAIAGDMIGAPYELEGNRIKDIRFPIFSSNSYPTDDTVQTVAIMKWLALSNNLDKDDLCRILKSMCLKYPNAGYGHSFKVWLHSNNLSPYNSFGNGSAMRVASIALYATSINDVFDLAKKTAEVTHNHSEGIKGAQAVASAIYLAYHGFCKNNIKKFIEDKFKYNLDGSICSIRENYSFNATCQGGVPQAIMAFLESVDFEDAIRLAVSLGGDADTQASISGAIAAAFYKEIPSHILNWVKRYNIAEFDEIKSKFIESIFMQKEFGHMMCCVTNRDVYMKGIQSYTFACTDTFNVFVPKGTRLLIDLKEEDQSIISCKVLNNKDIITNQFIQDYKVINPNEIDSLYSLGICMTKEYFDVIDVDLVKTSDLNP